MDGLVMHWTAQHCLHEMGHEMGSPRQQVNMCRAYLCSNETCCAWRESARNEPFKHLVPVVTCWTCITVWLLAIVTPTGVLCKLLPRTYEPCPKQPCPGCSLVVPPFCLFNPLGKDVTQRPAPACLRDRVQRLSRCMATVLYIASHQSNVVVHICVRSGLLCSADS